MKYDGLNIEQKIAMFNTAINMISQLDRHLIPPAKKADELTKEVLKVAKVIADNLEPV
jgi:hypothetical protein